MIDLDRTDADAGRVVLTVSGEVDVFSVPRLRAAMGDVVGAADVVVDLGGVTFCDSSVLRLLVDAQRDSAAAGHRLEVARPSPVVRDLFEVSGLRGVLHVVA
ncbi:STAS domain-containing protein [Iamia majanohamensis]|uniref:Anti-sigma factor antagonist n=1 Tax=Iamia majanohamensis TaxID=467976 RepID=A0AAE9Y5E0_9ACTN|nr:STAS domain-containing protein [Iamia majanohamensis]WCO65716.1 STAS domain-containing protein [Iamia majanohamensis]